MGAGDIIADHQGVFQDAFGRPLAVTNYTAGARDEQGDPERVPTDASPHETEGTVQQTTQAQEESGASGERLNIDVTMWLPVSVPVYDGTDQHPYPSTITDAETGIDYTATAVVDEGNGFTRVEAQRGQATE